MPIIQIYSNHKIPPSDITEIQTSFSNKLSLKPENVWVILSEPSAHKIYTGSQQHPVVIINCRTTYDNSLINEAVIDLQKILGTLLKIPESGIFCIIQRISPENIYSPINSKPQNQDPLLSISYENLNIKPIGTVSNGRIDVEDDNWGNIISIIQINPNLFSADATHGLQEFSHVEVLFYMHKVNSNKIISGARHPRNNFDWPKVGIFAQRGKNRMNQIGHTICRIIKVHEFQITVQGLDAINKTPVLDLKPVMTEFLPKEPVSQPKWAHQIMKNYF